MAKADLTYSIFEGILTGYVAGRFINIPAFSGGGGGGKHPQSANVNNPYKTSLKAGTVVSGKVMRGGPIPPGLYTISAPGENNFGSQAHPHMVYSAALKPAVANQTYGRAGFYIHGRGPKGSDGCIVPSNAADFHALMTALKSAGGGTLIVLETNDGSRFA